MLGTLVQLAKEMLQYEASIKNMSVEKLELNRLCWNPRKGTDEFKVVTLDLDRVGVRLEDYKDDERFRYLYALSTGKQSIGPSWVLDFSKKGKNRFEIVKGGFKQVKTGMSLLRSGISKRDHEWLEECLKRLSRYESKLTNAVSEVASTKRSLLTIECEGKKPGDLKSLTHSFVRRRLLGGERAQYVGKGVCGVCGSKGSVRPSLPFDKFFTVEKRGFSPMGFEIQSWKYAPLCENCTKWLYISQTFLNEHLRSRVAGTQAFLIPTLEPGASTIEGSFIQYLWEFRERSENRLAPRVEDIPDQLSEEEEENEQEDARYPNLLRDLVEKEQRPPFLSLSLIFHQQAGQKFLFLHSTPDILPRNLLAVKNTLSTLRDRFRAGLLGTLGKSKAKILSPDFNFVNYAWSWPKGKGEKKKSSGALKLNAMLLVEAILLRKPPSEEIFWSDVDNLLRAYFKKAISGGDQYTVRTVLSNQVALIWAVWNLLYPTDKGEHIMEPQPLTSETARTKLPPDFWQKFFAEKRMLDTSVTKALFLIGVLFGLVESFQRSERQWKRGGEMPILGRLRGLTVSFKDITIGLFPELKHKMRQLSGAYRPVRKIEAAAAEYLSHGGELDDAQARFYFTLGWSLEWHTYNSIKTVIGAEKEEAERVPPDTEPETEEQ